MPEITVMVQRIEQGDQQAADRLLPLVYAELRKLAIGNVLLAAIVLFYWPIDELSTAIFSGWAVLFNGGLAFIMRTMVPRY